MSTQDWLRSPSGLWLPPGSSSPAPTPARPTGIDLFCGAGGFSLGMERSGIDVVAACDADISAARTYLHNLAAPDCEVHVLGGETQEALERSLRRHGPLRLGDNNQGFAHPGCRVFYLGDARALTGQRILADLARRGVHGEIAVIFGGPPCQGFSRAGRRDVMDVRNSLVFEFARLVCEIRPQTLAMENVPGIESMVCPDGVPVLDRLASILSAGGFGVEEALGIQLRRDPDTRIAYRAAGPKAERARLKHDLQQARQRKARAQQELFATERP